MAVDSTRCPQCGNYGSLMSLKDENSLTTEYKGQTFAVQQYRCVACGLSDLVQRDTTRSERELPEPHPGRPAPGDGRHFSVAPIDPDEFDRAEAT